MRKVACTGMFMPPAFLSSHHDNESHSAGSGHPGDGAQSWDGRGAPARDRGNPLEVIVSRNGNLVPEEAAIGRDDEIRIIRIAHGG